MGKVIICKSGQKIYVPELYVSGSLKVRHQTDNNLFVASDYSSRQIAISNANTFGFDSLTTQGAVARVMSLFRGQATDLGTYADSVEPTDIIINEGAYLQLSPTKRILITPSDMDNYYLQPCYALRLRKSTSTIQIDTVTTNLELPDTFNGPSIVGLKNISSVMQTGRYTPSQTFKAKTLIVEAVDSDGYRVLMYGTVSIYRRYNDYDNWYGALNLYGVNEAYASASDPSIFNYNWIGDVIPDPLKPTDTTGGGDGDGDTSSDTVSLPDIEGLNNSSAVNNGLVNLYKLDNVQMRALGAYLWSDDFIDNIKKLKQSPMDAIISLMSMPVPIGSGSTDHIKVGNLTSTSTGVIVPQYIKVDCGSVYINKLVGNALDYSPYTRVEVCLPFCGNHILDTDDVMGKNINITYYVDLLSGSCIAFLSAEGQVLYNYSGSCGTGVPLSAVDRSAQTKAMVSMIANSIGAVAAGAGAAFGAPTGGQALSMASGAFQSGMDTMMAKNQIEHAGSISGDSGVMGFKKPYFIIERPNNAIPADYDSIKGYPSNIKVAHLSEMKGYTEVGYMNLTGFSEATAEEINEIEALLYSGVIL